MSMLGLVDMVEVLRFYKSEKHAIRLCVTAILPDIIPARLSCLDTFRLNVFSSINSKRIVKLFAPVCEWDHGKIYESALEGSYWDKSPHAIALKDEAWKMVRRIVPDQGIISGELAARRWMA